MIRFVSGSVLALALGLGGPAAAEEAASAPAGRKIFLDSNCNACHSIKSQGISVASEEAGSEPAEGEEGGKSSAPPDLSNVGNSKHDAKFLDDFLRKQATIDGRKHRRRFAGTPEERATLVAWLLTLKAPAK